MESRVDYIRLYFCSFARFLKGKKMRKISSICDILLIVTYYISPVRPIYHEPIALP